MKRRVGKIRKTLLGIVALALFSMASCVYFAAGRTLEPTLRSQAEAQDFFIGAAVDLGAFRENTEYRDLLAQEFNILTAENAMKLHNLQPEPNRFDFSGTDRLVAFAEANQMAVRGHVLVWHQSLPSWLKDGDWTRAEVLDLLETHIKTVVGRYRGQIVAWDVVNEAVNNDGTLRNSFWLKTIGPEYIELAFRWAHEADPDALLIYNDYGAEGRGGKSDAVYNLMESLLDKGVPVHGVGLQMHVRADQSPDAEAVLENMNQLAELGLVVQITEMDVRIEQPSTPDDWEQQAQVYQDMLQTCLLAENCNTFVTWGFTDRHSWVPHYFEGWGEALLFDDEFQPKPAYHSLLEALSSQE